jgi:hypothetical protein
MEEYNSLYPFFRNTIRNDGITEDELDEKLSGYRFYMKRRENIPAAPLDILHSLPSTEELPPAPGALGRIKRFFSAVANPLRRGYSKILNSFLWDNHPICFQAVPRAFLSTTIIALFIIAGGQPFWAFTFVNDKRFVRSGISTAVNTVIFQQIVKNAKLMEPFYLLTREGGAPRSVLNLRDNWPFQDLFRCAKILYLTKQKSLSDLVMPTVVIAAYAANLFVVTWNVLALNNDSTSGSFWVNLGLQICCEIWMLLSLTLIFLYWRQPLLPRMPLTIGSNLLFVYATDIPSLKYPEYQKLKSNSPLGSLIPSMGSLAGGSQSRLFGYSTDADHAQPAKEEIVREKCPAEPEAAVVLAEHLPMPLHQGNTNCDPMSTESSDAHTPSGTTMRPHNILPLIKPGNHAPHRVNNAECNTTNLPMSTAKHITPLSANSSIDIEKPGEASATDAQSPGGIQAHLGRTGSATSSTKMNNHEDRLISDPSLRVSTGPMAAEPEEPLRVHEPPSTVGIPHNSALSMPRTPSQRSSQTHPWESRELSARLGGGTVRDQRPTTMTTKTTAQEEDTMCAFGQFIGRDGLEHTGLGKWNEDFLIYRWRPPRKRSECDVEMRSR